MNPPSLPVKWAGTAAAILAACLAGWLLSGRARAVRDGFRGARLYDEGRTSEAWPVLREAVEATSLQSKPCVDLGNLAVWAIDDGGFQHQQGIQDPWSLARTAFVAYAEALDRQPGNPRAWAGMAELFKKARLLRMKEGTLDLESLGQPAPGKLQEEDDFLIAAYRKALHFEPSNYFYHAYLGDFYDERGFRKKAVASYARAVEIMPDLSWHYYLPKHDLPKDLYDALSAALQRALTTNPTVPKDRIMQNMGALSEMEGDIDAAMQHYRDAASIAGDPSVYLYMLGNLLFREKDCDEAEKILGQAIERGTLQPRTMALSHTLIGACRSRNDDLEGAVTHLEQARWINPNAWYIASDLAAAYEKMGETDKAEAEYRAAIRLAPARASVYSGLIRMYRNTHQLSKAIPLAEKLVKMFPDNQVFKDQLDSIYRELGRPNRG